METLVYTFLLIATLGVIFALYFSEIRLELQENN